MANLSSSRRATYKDLVKLGIIKSRQHLSYAIRHQDFPAPRKAHPGHQQAAADWDEAEAVEWHERRNSFIEPEPAE